MAVSNGWSMISDETLARLNARIKEDNYAYGHSVGYDDGFEDGVQEAEDRMARWYQQEVDHLRQGTVTLEAHRDLEARVAKLEAQGCKVPYMFEQRTHALQQQIETIKNDIVSMDRFNDSRHDEVVHGMKLTSDRVTTLAQDTTKRCELLRNQIYDLNPGW